MFNKDIIKLTKENNFFRKEIVTGKHSQVVLMCVEVGGDIGEEIHHVDQTLVFVEGSGESILNDEKKEVGEGSLVFVPAGTKHNFINTGTIPLKLYTVYAPAEHEPNVIHKTKEEAKIDEIDKTFESRHGLVG